MLEVCSTGWAGNFYFRVLEYNKKYFLKYPFFLNFWNVGRKILYLLANPERFFTTCKEYGGISCENSKAAKLFLKLHI